MLIRALVLIQLCLLSSMAWAADRPNIVWILSEDNSKHYLKLFDEYGAETPNIEALAQSGIIFNHAFSCGPVCSVARTTLQTGCYGPRIGTQYHRRTKLANLPAGVRMFPALLREAGYYTTNNSKKDYNAVEGKGVWDESSKKASWRKRPEGDMPFFHMQTFTMSHESSLHFKAAHIKPEQLTHSPDSVELADYFPDTPTFRYTHARYLDSMVVIDKAVGDLVAKLTEDGLLEDTFIFYFGDHGGVLPRSKGYIYESGLHVPLVVRIPENWRSLSALKPGSRTDGFVEFVDFGPTVLNLAGVKTPSAVDGRPFLGADVSAEEIESRDEAFGHADRFDEKYDMCRSLRKGKYKYIRHYHAFYPDGLQNNYRYRMLAYQEWRKLYGEGKLNSKQRQFFEPKPVEALYDIEEDPHEVHSLVTSPKHAEVLEDLRNRLTQRVKAMQDLSFFPESYLVDYAMDDPVKFGQNNAARIGELVDVADLSLLPFKKAKEKLKAALDAEDPWQRYWALIACSCFGDQARYFVPMAIERLTDDEPLVRVRAAELLGILGAADPRPTLINVLESTRSPTEASITLNTVTYFQDRREEPLKLDVSKIQIRAKGDGVKRRLEYLEK